MMTLSGLILVKKMSKVKVLGSEIGWPWVVLFKGLPTYAVSDYHDYCYYFIHLVCG